jgi:hypothetical protein
MEIKMDHEKIKELINLSIYDELNEDEKVLLEEHLLHCEACRSENEEVKKLDGLLANLKLPEIDNRILKEARFELRAAIKKERSRKSFWESLLENINQLLTRNYRFAFGSIALILVGIGIGYLLFMNKENIGAAQFINAAQSDPFERNNIKIKNLRFLDADASDGEVSFTFDAIKPVTMKGKVNDVIIQKVLAHSLINEQNDGVRLRTLNAISEQTINKDLPDAKVKTALITALKYDGNAGVRKEALNVLKKYSADEEIIEALLYVVKNDSNSGLRVAAINSLSELKFSEKEFSPEMLDLLKQKSQNDENQYVRIRAKSILQEVYQQ